MYTLIRTLNELRKREGIGTAPMTLQYADRASLVISRTATDAGAPGRRTAGRVWLFVNNKGAASEHAPRDYCPPQLPPTPPIGWRWSDALSGEVATFDGGCYKANDGRPKVLVLSRGEGGVGS